MPSRPLARSSLALLLAAGPLLACAPQQATQQPHTPMTAAQYETFQRVMSSNPRARATWIAACTEHNKQRSAEELGSISAILDVDPAEAGRVFCERLVAAVARGDVSYADYAAMQANTQDMQLFRRLLRALRQPANEQQV